MDSRVNTSIICVQTCVFVLKYFPFTLPYTSLKATLVYNDTIYLVPSMTL
jgi:hypothetical protein